MKQSPVLVIPLHTSQYMPTEIWIGKLLTKEIWLSARTLTSSQNKQIADSRHRIRTPPTQPVMFLVLSYIGRDIFKEMSKGSTDKTCSSFLFDSREFHQRYLVALTWTWCELVVWVSSGVGWIKQRCSRGRTGQQGHGSGVCRSQISRINYCNVSYQFPAGLCQLCTKRGKGSETLPERQPSTNVFNLVQRHQLLSILFQINSFVVA